MTTEADIQALDRLLDPLRDCLTPDVARRIVDLRADPESQAKLDDFADRHAEGRLSADETVEYDALVQAASLIAVLQAKARSLLNGKT